MTRRAAAPLLPRGLGAAFAIFTAAVSTSELPRRRGGAPGDRPGGAGTARAAVAFSAAGWIGLGAWLAVKQLVWSPVALSGAGTGRGAIVASVAVALCLVGIAVRLTGRAQVAALLAVDALLTLVLQIQLLYERQYSELASIASLAFAPQAAQVAGAVAALFRRGDALLWVDVLLLSAALAVGIPAAAAPARLSNALVACGMLMFIPPVLPLADRPLTGPRRLAVSRAEVASSLGVVGYQLFDAARFVQRRFERSARTSLREVAAYHRQRPAPAGPLTATERGRNVIVVQLESTQGFAVGRTVGGVPVTPTLERLARESLTFAHAFTQAAQGTTSDAEFAATCSMYPLEAGAVFTDRYDARFRCLPRILRERGYRTVAMHANWPNFWNRDRMYPAVGYDAFLSIRDFDRAPVIGLGLSDARFFEQAVERLAASPRPFYAMLVTLSNHAPFDDAALARTLPLGPLAGTYVGDYLDSVHDADAALGTLVERLRATGLLDTSILVVYGDHAGVSRHASGTAWLDLRARPDMWLLHEGTVPLLVRLPGGRAAGVRQDPAGQVDVAPTLADLLGVPPSETFFHGRSLVSDAPRPVVLPDGSAVTRDRIYVGPARRWGPPACVEAASGAVLDAAQCDDLAEHAARELAVSRAEVEQDLLPWLMAGSPSAATSSTADDDAPPR